VRPHSAAPRCGSKQLISANFDCPGALRCRVCSVRSGQCCPFAHTLLGVSPYICSQQAPACAPERQLSPLANTAETEFGVSGCSRPVLSGCNSLCTVPDTCTTCGKLLTPLGPRCTRQRTVCGLCYNLQRKQYTRQRTSRTKGRPNQSCRPVNSLVGDPCRLQWTPPLLAHLQLAP